MAAVIIAGLIVPGPVPTVVIASIVRPPVIPARVQVAVQRRRDKPGTGRGGRRSGRNRCTRTRKLGGAVYDLVQLAAVKPHAPALRTVVDLHSTALTHYQVY